MIALTTIITLVTLIVTLSKSVIGCSNNDNKEQLSNEQLKSFEISN